MLPKLVYPQETCSSGHSNLHVANCDHWSQLLWGGKSHQTQTFTEVGETGFLALLPLWAPRPLFFVASTAAPLESRSSAALTWPLHAARWSGVSPQALSPGSRRPLWLPADDGERCGQLSSTGSTDCFGLNIFKTVPSKKHSQTKWTRFNTSFL